MITPETARELSQTAIGGYKESFDKKIENEVSNLIQRQANYGINQCEFSAFDIGIPPFLTELFDQILKAKLVGFSVRRSHKDKWIVSWQVGGDQNEHKCKCCGNQHAPPPGRSNDPPRNNKF